MYVVESKVDGNLYCFMCDVSHIKVEGRRGGFKEDMSRRNSSRIKSMSHNAKAKRQDPVSTSSLIRMERPDPPPQSAQVTQSAARKPPRRRSSTSDVNTKQSESAKRRGDLTSNTQTQREEEGRTSTTNTSRLLQRSSTGSSSRRRSSINSNGGDINNQTLDQVRRVFEKKRSEKTLDLHLERPSVPHVPSRRLPPNRRHSMQNDTRQHHRDTRIGKEDESERPADLTSFFERKGSEGIGQRQEGLVSYKVGDTLKCSTHSLRFSSTEQAAKVLSDIPINTPLFVKRTDRYWSYATLIERIRDENSQLTHVVVSLTNANGNEGGIMKTKIIQSSRWPVCLMMVNSRKVLTTAIVRDDDDDDETNVSVQALSGKDGCSPSV